MKRYLVLLLLSVVAVAFAEEQRIEEEEVKIPLSIEVDIRRNSQFAIVLQTKDTVFVPEGNKIIKTYAELDTVDEEGNSYESSKILILSGLPSQPAKKGDEMGEELKLRWGELLEANIGALAGKQLHVTGSVYYEMPLKIMKIDPPQPLIMKKGEKLIWEDFIMEICSEPVVATSMNWDGQKKAYIAEQVEGRPLSFFVPVRIEAPDDLEIWDEKFFDLSSKELKTEGWCFYHFSIDRKDRQTRYYQFPAEHKCEELLVSLNYTKGRIRYRIPVDLKVTVPEKEQEEPQRKENL